MGRVSSGTRLPAFACGDYPLSTLITKIAVPGEACVILNLFQDPSNKVKFIICAVPSAPPWGFGDKPPRPPIIRASP
jgi:hypothetical protein